MILNSESQKIILENAINQHILAVGASGTGKTFLDVRLIEDAYLKGRKMMVLDQSFSYSQKELLDKGCTVCNSIWHRNPDNEALFFQLSPQTPEGAGKQIAAALLESLGIESYNQRQILVDACTQLLLSEKKFCFPSLIALLNFYQNNFLLNDSIRININRLLNRLAIMEEFYNFAVVIGTEAIPAENEIEIFQFSGLPTLQRSIMLTFLLSLIWDEIRKGNGDFCCDTILLDEFQNLSFAEGGALYSILREGRKFGLQAILSTQYLSCFSANQLNALQQAATAFFFRPTAKDLGKIAKLIDEENTAAWRKILRRLERGEAVLLGSYHIKGHSHPISTPIKIKVCTNPTFPEAAPSYPLIKNAHYVN